MISEAKKKKKKVKDGLQDRASVACSIYFCVIIDKWNQICLNNKYKSRLLSHLITFPSKYYVCRQDEARTQNEFVSVYERLQSVLDYSVGVLTGCLFATYVTQHQLWMQMNSSKCHFPSIVQVSNGCWGTPCSMEGPRARLWSFNNWGLAAATAKIAICCRERNRAISEPPIFAGFLGAIQDL